MPLFFGWLVVRWLKKHAPSTMRPETLAFFEQRPIERKWFRAARRDGRDLMLIGDFEKQMEAVDAAYLAKERAQDAGEKAEFLVFNDKAELLEQVDS